jgi:hypothetical protein
MIPAVLPYSFQHAYAPTQPLKIKSATIVICLACMVPLRTKIIKDQ